MLINIILCITSLIFIIYTCLFVTGRLDNNKFSNKSIIHRSIAISLYKSVLSGVLFSLALYAIPKLFTIEKIDVNDAIIIYSSISIYIFIFGFISLSQAFNNIKENNYDIEYIVKIMDFKVESFKGRVDFLLVISSLFICFFLTLIIICSYVYYLGVKLEGDVIIFFISLFLFLISLIFQAFFTTIEVLFLDAQKVK